MDQSILGEEALSSETSGDWSFPGNKSFFSLENALERTGLPTTL